MLDEPEQAWGELFAFTFGALLIGLGIVCFAVLIWLSLNMVAYSTELKLAAPIRPDATLTPGMINPMITQDNIGQTICAGRKWSTKSIRPPEEYTSKLKHKQLAHGYPSRNMKLYEEDHLISLELGGHPTDPRNLWPEVYDDPCGAKVKDALENKLHEMVCAGEITLAGAQGEIASDWVRSYNLHLGKLVCE